MLEMLEHVKHPDRGQAAIGELQILQRPAERGDVVPCRGFGSGLQRFHGDHIDARLREPNGHGPRAGTDVPESCDSLSSQEVKDDIEAMVEPESVATVEPQDVEAGLGIRDVCSI
jgi:hypothetical protein